jgi:hypothetical protein
MNARLQRRLISASLLAASSAFVTVPGVRAEGIPEPDLIWYGKVLNTHNGQTVRVTAGTLQWTLSPAQGGPPRTLLVTLTNINDQFSYVARLRCETPLNGATPNPDAFPIQNPPTTYNRASVTLDGKPLSLAGAPAQFALSPDQRGRVERIDLVFGAAISDADNDGLPTRGKTSTSPAATPRPTRTRTTTGSATSRNTSPEPPPWIPRPGSRFSKSFRNRARSPFAGPARRASPTEFSAPRNSLPTARVSPS